MKGSLSALAGLALMAAVHVFNPDTGAWSDRPLPVPSEVLSTRGCWHGFCCPEVNAHSFYISRDSDDRGTMWVYRCAKADK